MEKSRAIRTAILLSVIICSVLFYMLLPRQNTDTSRQDDFFPAILSTDVKPADEEKHARLFSDEEGKETMEGLYGIDPGILRREFPGNRALPALTAEEQSRKNEEREKRNRVYGRIISNRASDKEVHQYYEEQSKLTADTVELLEFILDRYAGTLTEKERKKHTFLLEQYRKRLDVIPLKEKESLERIRMAR